MSRLEFGQACCAKCKEADDTLAHTDTPWGSFVLCKPCRIGEFKKIAIESVRKGISDLHYLLDIHLKNIAPYSLESLNDLPVNKFVKKMKDTMLFTDEWLEKYKELEKARE